MKVIPSHDNFNSSNILVEYCWRDMIVFHSMSSSYLTSSIAVCVLIFIFGIVGTFFNTVVLFVFLKSKNMRRKTSCFSIMILSATDLIVVTSVPAVFLGNKIHEILGTPRCLYGICFNIVNRTTPLLSASSLITMNIERYLAIVHPLFHHSIVTKRKIVFTFIVTGCIFFTCAAISLAWNEIGDSIFSVGAFIICTTTLFQYVSIFFIARKALIRRVTNVNDEGISSSLRAFLRDLKLAKMYFMIVFLCFLCYLPVVIIGGAWKLFSANEETRNALFHWGLSVSPLIVMNATFDCLIFFWGNRELRKQSWKLIINCFRRTSH